MVCIPTHDDDAVMNGAPDQLWLVEGEQAIAKGVDFPASLGISRNRSTVLAAEVERLAGVA